MTDPTPPPEGGMRWVDEPTPSTPETKPETPKDPEQAAREADAKAVHEGFKGRPPRLVGDVPRPEIGPPPPWFPLPPEGLAVPRGRVPLFLRFPASWTDTPSMGIELAAPLSVHEAAAFRLAGEKVPELWRTACMWSVSIGDKKLALGRAQGDPNRWNEVLVQAMVRVVDGTLVDRSDGSLDIWWERLGERCRAEVLRCGLRLSSLTDEQRRVFYGVCVEARAGS